MKINGNPDGGGGGAAVWGGITGNINSQTDLNQQFVKKTGLKTVNEQSLVGSGDIEVGTLNPEDLKTINSQSIVGTGDIEVGGLTPEQEAAIEPLVNSSEGILYTSVFGSNSVKVFSCSAPDISNRLNKIYNVGGGDIYYTYGNQLYKYNPELMDFEKVAEFDNNVDHIWKDTQGGLHSGKDYDIDIVNQTLTYHQRSTGYGLSNIDSTNRINIFVGSKGVYDLNNTSWGSQSKSYKYSNETELFNTGQYVAGDIKLAVRLCCSFLYKGHYLFMYNDVCYEITEGDDEVLTTTNVDGVYFRTPTDEIDGFTIGSRYNLFVVNGDLYYIYWQNAYRWNDDNQLWESLNLSGYDSGFDTSYVVSGNYVIGGISSQANELYFINLGNSEVKSTSWIETNKVAVDLTSDQQIYGSKSFNNAYINDLRVGALALQSYNYTLNVGDMTLEGDRLNIAVKDVLIGGGIPATRDMCYVNRTLISPGINFETICDIPRYNFNNVDQNWKMWYLVPSGDLFYINDYRNYAYKYDSINNEFVTVNTINNKIVSSHRAVLNQGTELWISKDGSVYRWNNSTEDFDFIISTPDNDDWIWQGDDTTLRYKDMYVLAYDSGTDTYSWDQVQTAPTFNECYSYILNGQIYQYIPLWNAFYTWDESTGQESLVDYTVEVPQDEFYLAPVNGHLYYYTPSGSIRMINISAAGSDNFDVETNIPSGKGSGQNYPPIFEYDGKYCTERNYNGNEQFCYTYEYSYWAPQPDTSTDGTYVLKATVLNGEVTYAWVEDVDAQAIQITNQILG